MNKARACVKSVKSRGALACAFLLRAWRKLLCRWNYHADTPSVWYDLHLDHPDGTAKLVGVRISFCCSRCNSTMNSQHFETSADRLHWNAHPERRRVTVRDWSAQ
jgi:hypothetical protein